MSTSFVFFISAHSVEINLLSITVSYSALLEYSNGNAREAYLIIWQWAAVGVLQRTAIDAQQCPVDAVVRRRRHVFAHLNSKRRMWSVERSRHAVAGHRNQRRRFDGLVQKQIEVNYTVINRRADAHMEVCKCY